MHSAWPTGQIYSGQFCGEGVTLALYGLHTVWSRPCSWMWCSREAAGLIGPPNKYTILVWQSRDLMSLTIERRQWVQWIQRGDIMKVAKYLWTFHVLSGPYARAICCCWEYIYVMKKEQERTHLCLFCCSWLECDTASSHRWAWRELHTGIRLAGSPSQWSLAWTWDITMWSTVYPWAEKDSQLPNSDGNIYWPW